MSIPINNGKGEGVPEGWRLVAFRPPRQGEYYISAYTGEVLELNHGGPFCSVAIVVPDNVYGVRDPLKDVLAPHGYKAVAFRVPQLRETWISSDGGIVQGMPGREIDMPRVIIEPLPPPPKPKLKVMIGEWLVSDEVVHPDRVSSATAANFTTSRPNTYRIEERDA